jgi:hypothetical protein
MNQDPLSPEHVANRISQFAVQAGGYEVAPYDFLLRQHELQRFAQLLISDVVSNARRIQQVSPDFERVMLNMYNLEIKL